MIELREIFQTILSYLEKSIDSDWSAASVDEMKQLMIVSIDALDSCQKLNKLELQVAFAPTSFLQEIVITNCWSTAYLKLSERFDVLIEEYYR